MVLLVPPETLEMQVFRALKARLEAMAMTVSKDQPESDYKVRKATQATKVFRASKELSVLKEQLVRQVLSVLTATMVLRVM
jgi:hypothetical protein